MKKYKYLTLSKEEQKKLQEKYFQTNDGINLKKIFNRIIMYSICLIIIGIVLSVQNYLNDKGTTSYIYSIFLVIVGIAFLIARHNIFIKKINEYLINSKKKSK